MRSSSTAATLRLFLEASGVERLAFTRSAEVQEHSSWREWLEGFGTSLLRRSRAHFLGV